MSLLLAILANGASTVRGEDLNSSDLYNLVAGGPEGTTIVFEGGAQRAYFSPRLNNAARLGLGRTFMKEQWPDIIAEGVFVASVVKGGKQQLISGLAAINVDKSTGSGFLVFVQTFPTDKTRRAFDAKDRLFMAMTVEETPSTLLCTPFEWIMMSKAKNSKSKPPGPCEFVVGNVVVASSPR